MIPNPGIGFADVGTDHGYIPVWLASSNYSGNIFAFDVAEEPLKRAVTYALEADVADRIQFCISDGLDACPPNQVDCIMIAGLGGDAICRILDRAEWLSSGPYQLILQPMTHAEVLRYWLLHNEFQITEEIIVSEDSHIYQMFHAVPGKSVSVSDAEYCAGILSCSRGGESPLLLYRDLADKIQKKLDGLWQGSNTGNSSAYLFYSNISRELENLAEERKITKEISN